MLSLVLLSSCEKGGLEPESGEGMVSLSLDPGKMGITKASEYGSDALNENMIGSFRLYFYTAAAGEDDAAVYVWPESGWATADNSSATVSGATGTDPATGKVSVSFVLSKTLVNSLFPSEATSCSVYAVANVDGVGTLPSGLPSRKALKQTVVTAEFGPTTGEDPYAVKQSSFVMDGEATLTRDPDKMSVSGDVKMYRAASKITFTVTEVTNEGVEDTDLDGKKDWEPLTGQMRVYYVNGINTGYLDGTMAKTQRETGMFNYKANGKGRSLSGDATAGWTHALPFYSYYNYWRPESGSTTGDEGDAPYLLLSMPWKHRITGSTGTADSDYDRYFTCWYAVPFNTVTGHLERNAWYKINLSVSILGSGDPDNPTVVNPSYMILPWGNETVKTNAELFRYRYLMVDENEYVMNNVNSLTIPYYTSHPVSVVSDSLTKTILKPLSGYKPYEQTVYSGYTLNVNSDNTGIVFTHDLVNDYSSNYDVTAYTLTFTIQHTDDASFSETITVVQYPALYVVAELNSDCKDPVTVKTSGRKTTSGTSLSGNHDHYGYVYINGSQSTNAYASSRGWTSAEWPVVSDQSNVGNTDPYMYVVTVSALPTGSSYVIGDPRTADISVPSFSTYYIESNSGGGGGYGGGGNSRTAVSQWATAKDMDGTSRQLKDYYPADEDGDRVNNMIAPSFRIASSYGVVGVVTYEEAKKRCASYQEDGYPAGRWRVPTAAEISYMVKLAYDEKIPVLLSSSSYYWGSNKAAYQPNGKGGVTSTTSSDNTHVRCVYDEWYWTDKLSDTQKNTFTWGAKQR